MTESLPLDRPRVLGELETPVSPIGWGLWRFRGLDVGQAASLAHGALDNGFTLFDTADIYGAEGAAEELLGRVFRADPSIRRRIVLATKGGIVRGVPYDSSARHIIAACEASLRRLQTEVIDLYQIHRPDVLTHPDELAQALSQLRAAGKIRTVGVSNYSVSQTRALQACLPFRLASHQPEFSALHLEPLTDGILDHAIEQRMAVLAWSPLAGGRLGGEADDPRTQAVQAALDTLAARERVSRAAAAYAWLLAHPSRPIVLAGTQKLERMAEAARALSVRLNRADWYRILTASRQHELP